jgi:hypothetical protein
MERRMSPELEARFNLFWSSYPKKRDRVDAQRAWRKINPSEVELLLILQGINRYMASGEWRDPQFIPYPATFLNGRRWEDELSQANEAATPPTRFCGICGRTGSWHLNETKHGRPVNHNFVESVAS